MLKLMLLFKKPEDGIEFRNRLEQDYWPLVLKTPGLQSAHMYYVQADAFGGEPTYFMIAEFGFADKDSFRHAMQSHEHMLAGRELMGFARGYVSLHVVEQLDEFQSV